MPPELKQLEDSVGEFMQYWGFRKIFGRIWAHLYTSTRPLDSASLIKRLKVSKGLLSIALREMMEYDVIRPAESGKFGTVYYEANPNLFAVIANVLRQRENRMLGEARLAAESLSQLQDAELQNFGIHQDRVESILLLTSSAQSLLASFLAQSQPDDKNPFLNLNPMASLRSL